MSYELKRVDNFDIVMLLMKADDILQMCFNAAIETLGKLFGNWNLLYAHCSASSIDSLMSWMARRNSWLASAAWQAR